MVDQMLCGNNDDVTYFYFCNETTGQRQCQPDFYGLPNCTTHCISGITWNCNKTTGRKVCFVKWYGPKCDVSCGSIDQVICKVDADNLLNCDCLPKPPTSNFIYQVLLGGFGAATLFLSIFILVLFLRYRAHKRSAHGALDQLMPKKSTPAQSMDNELIYSPSTDRLATEQLQRKRMELLMRLTEERRRVQHDENSGYIDTDEANQRSWSTSVKQVPKVGHEQRSSLPELGDTIAAKRLSKLGKKNNQGGVKFWLGKGRKKNTLDNDGIREEIEDYVATVSLLRRNQSAGTFSCLCGSPSCASRIRIGNNQCLANSMGNEARMLTSIQRQTAPSMPIQNEANTNLNQHSEWDTAGYIEICPKTGETTGRAKTVCYSKRPRYQRSIKLPKSSSDTQNDAYNISLSSHEDDKMSSSSGETIGSREQMSRKNSQPTDITEKEGDHF